VLSLPDHWVWDFWLADDGEDYHLFFLKAPRSVASGLRHWSVCVGHATSRDLRGWRVVEDALRPSDTPAFDDLATWTGSVVRDDVGTWRLFYTGLSRAEDGMVQRVGLATSADLMTWTKHGPQALVEADERWYRRWSPGSAAETWRDPWVFRGPDGDGWHMLVTASAREGGADQGGVVGHARSADLLVWKVQPPLSHPGAGFSQLEVIQTEVIEGQPVLLFSCLGPELSASRHAAGERGGVWCVESASVTGPFDPSAARRVTDESMYVGRLAQERGGAWVLLAFRNEGPDGQFVGGVTDPIPFSLRHRWPLSAPASPPMRVGEQP